MPADPNAGSSASSSSSSSSSSSPSPSPSPSASPSSSPVQPQASVTDVDPGTSVKVTDEPKAKKTEDQGEKDAARLMNELLEKKKQGHDESAVGIMNLLNVLYNNVRKNWNWMVERSAENVKKALRENQKAQEDLKANPNDPQLQQKAINARQKFDEVLKKERKFCDVMGQNSPGDGFLEQIGFTLSRGAEMAPKMVGGVGDKFWVMDAAVRGLGKKINENQENKAIEDKSKSQGPKSP